MSLYIQVENGQVVNHPAFEDNLIEAFGAIPDNWKPFNRIETPILTDIFQTVVNTYTLGSGGVWFDSWAVLDMTETEKAALIATTEANPPYPNAILDTATLQWSRPPKPTDGQNYKFNFITGTWDILNAESTITTPIA